MIRSDQSSDTDDKKHEADVNYIMEVKLAEYLKRKTGIELIWCHYCGQWKESHGHRREIDENNQKNN